MGEFLKNKIIKYRFPSRTKGEEKSGKKDQCEALERNLCSWVGTDKISESTKKRMANLVECQAVLYSPDK